MVSFVQKGAELKPDIAARCQAKVLSPSFVASTFSTFERHGTGHIFDEADDL